MSQSVVSQWYLAFMRIDYRFNEYTRTAVFCLLNKSFNLREFEEYCCNRECCQGVGRRDDFVKRLGTRCRGLIEVNKAAKNCNEEGFLMKRDQESRVSAEEDKAVTYVSNQALPTRKKLHSTSSTRIRATPRRAVLTRFKSYFADLLILLSYNNKWESR